MSVNEDKKNEAWLTVSSVNNWLGRRGVIFVSANFCLWPVIGSAFCHAWPEQLACRLLMGIGMGIKASTGKTFHFLRLAFQLSSSHPNLHASQFLCTPPKTRPLLSVVLWS